MIKDYTDDWKRRVLLFLFCAGELVVLGLFILMALVWLGALI